MDKLLWLLLMFRVLRVAAPFVLGVIGALWAIGFVPPAVPPGWLILFFVFVAACLIGELRKVFGPGTDSHQRRDRRHDGQA